MTISRHMNLFKLSLSLQGIDLAHAITELARTRQNLLERQRAKKWDIFNHHINNTSFYKSFVNGVAGSKWCDIPILQKSDVQQPLSKLLSSDYSVKDVYRNNTSGSTGKPFHFAKDKYCHAMTWAYIVVAYERLGLEYGKSLQARFFLEFLSVLQSF